MKRRKRLRNWWITYINTTFHCLLGNHKDCTRCYCDCHYNLKENA